MSDTGSGRRIAAAALSSLMSGVGQNVSDRVRQELDSTRSDGEPQSAKRTAAAALGGLVGGMGQNVSEMVRQELGAARSDVVESAKSAARGAGLLGGAAAAGHTAVLFVGVAVWRGLGNRIGFARSALVVAALSGAAAAALASSGTAELSRVRAATRTSKAPGPVAPPVSGSTVVPAPEERPGAATAEPDTAV